MRTLVLCVSIAGLMFVGCGDDTDDGNGSLNGQSAAAGQSYCEFVASCGMTTAEECEAGMSDEALAAAEAINCGDAFNAQVACMMDLDTCDDLAAASTMTEDADAPCAAEGAALAGCMMAGMGDMMGEGMDGM